MPQGEHNFEQLKEHILPLSDADAFNVARREWDLVDVEMHEEWDNCPCGQPIKELCYIHNRVTDERTYVGNVCVNRFIGIQTGNLFAGLKRIAADDTANANTDLIKHAYRLGYIRSEKEYNFLLSTRRGRKLSGKQLSWKQDINRRIINKIVVRRPKS